MTPETETAREAILRDARDKERDRLRRLARARWPDADDTELDDRVRQLTTEKLDAAGRLGRATQQERARLARRYAALRGDLQTSAEHILQLIRDIDGDAA